MGADGDLPKPFNARELLARIKGVLRRSLPASTGLGLSIARTIAEYHGGTLTLSKHQDGGLEARLVLPRI